MGCVQKLLVLQATERALMSVRSEHSLAERSLMQPLPSQSGDVFAAPLSVLARRWLGGGGPVQLRHVVDGNGEDQSVWIIGNDEDRPCGEIATGNQAMEID
jgi:hypothetical protein